jgi:hypothetical protein
MRKIGTAVALAIAMLLAPSVSQAKGCIKGALVGGVAGHYAGHHGARSFGCIPGHAAAFVASQVPFCTAQAISRNAHQIDL